MEIFLGLIVSLITFFCGIALKQITDYMNCHEFKQIFGKDVTTGELHCVYASFNLIPIFDSNGHNITHPYIKQNGGMFSIDNPVSGCEVRSLKYIAEIVARESKKSVIMSTDREMNNKLDISCVCFGGPLSNYKTNDILKSEDNRLIGFNNNDFFDMLTHKKVLKIEPGFDYGLILKVVPEQFKQRSWIICAGIGEWGTSGSTWYLVHNWKEIYNYSKAAEFAIIVKVKPGQDESAIPVVKVKSNQEIKQLLYDEVIVD